MGAASGMGGGSPTQSGNTQQSSPPPRMPSNAVYPTFSTPTGEEGTLSPGAYNRAFSQAGQNMGGLQAMDQSIRDYVKQNMGNYGGMVDKANELELSQRDIARAGGVPMGGVYTYMNRPDYQTYGPSGQFNQPIYQTSYDQYAQPSSFYRPSYNPFSYGGMGGMGVAPRPMPNSTMTDSYPIEILNRRGGQDSSTPSSMIQRTFNPANVMMAPGAGTMGMDLGPMFAAGGGVEDQGIAALLNK